MKDLLVLNVWKNDSGEGRLHWVGCGLVVFLILLASWLDPGVTRPYPGLTVFLGGICAVWGGLLLTRHPANAKREVAFANAVLFLAWGFLASIWSVDSFRTQQTMASWTAAVGLFTVLACSTVSGRLWRATVWMLVAASVLTCCVGLVDISATDPLLKGNFSNTDTFSVVPLVGLFLVLTEALSNDARMRITAWSVAAFLTLALMRTGSRAALAGMVMGLVTILASAALHRNRGVFRSFLRSSTILLSVLVLFAAVSGFVAPLFERVNELSQGKDLQGVAMRQDVLRHGLAASLAHPLRGSGPGTFALTYQQYRPQSLVPEYIYVNVAHNDFIEVLVEFGYPGFALWAGLWFLALLRAVRLIRHETGAWEATALAAGMSALLAFSLFNFIIAVPAVLFWELALLGLLHGMPVGAMSGQSQKPAEFHKKGLLLLAAAVWTVFFGFYSSRAVKYETEARKLSTALRWEEALQATNSAIAAQPQNATLYTFRAECRNAISKFKDKPHEEKSATEDISTAIRLSPQDSAIRSAAVRIFESNKDFAKAEENLRALMDLSPYKRDNIFPELTRVLLMRKHYRECAEMLLSAAESNVEIEEKVPDLLLFLEKERPGELREVLSSWTGHQDEAPKIFGIFLETADLALARRQPQVALGVLEILGKNNPDDLRTQFLLSRCYGATGEPGRQREILRKIKNASPKDSDQAYVDQALVELARLQPTDALKLESLRGLEQRLRIRPRSIDIRLFLSANYLRKGKIEEASEIISRGLDVHPTDSRLLARMGTCLAAQGLTEMSKDYYQQALASDPANREARTGRLPKNN